MSLLVEMVRISPYQYYQKRSLKLRNSHLKDAFKQMIFSFFSLKPYQFLLNEFHFLSLKKYVQLEYYRYRLFRNYPIEYLLNEKEFLSTPFFIKKGVLIPRIETEGLVEITLKRAKEKDRILDVGCGSGNIAISLKKMNPSLEMEAIDISRSAIKITRKNMRTILGEELPLYKKSLKFFQTDRKYNAIVSNPPYVAKEEKNLMGPGVLRYEPKAALFAERDGLFFYHLIRDRLKDLLLVGGSLYLECGFNQASAVKDIFSACFGEEVLIEKDCFGKERYVIARGYLG